MIAPCPNRGICVPSSSRRDDNWRSGLHVLVPDAHAVGMIGVIRSLGRAGYAVHACGCVPDALGLASRYASVAVCSPPYEDPGFLPWLRDYVARLGISAIVPSDAFLLAIRPAFPEFASLLPVPRDPGLVYAAISKHDVFRQLMGSRQAGAHLPPTRLLKPGDPLPSASEIEALGLPVFIKVDGVHAIASGGDGIFRAESVVTALARVAMLRERYSHLTLQGYVPGLGAGVYFLRWDGELRSEFMNICLHEVPHTGGFCSLRESWRHEAMREDARHKLQEIGWQGVAMLEYRWDSASGRFYFVELNARFWAALHLALFAGVDFPRLLVDAFHGRLEAPVTSYPVGLRCRLAAPFEISYLLSRWRDRALPLVSRLWSVVEFFMLFLDPRPRADLLFPGDRGLYWRQWARVMRTLLRGSAARRDRGATELRRETPG
jgi:hypothetical protein